MSSNQSGKQLFEWVKASERLPEKKDTYFVKLFSYVYGIEHGIYSGTRIFDPNIGWADSILHPHGLGVLEWLSPAQPYTGKQLPTDDEIWNHTDEIYDDSLDGQTNAESYVNGAKWMRERAQGESDKWIRVDTPPKEGGRYWCYVREVNDLGVSHYQWNCGYDPDENRWYDKDLKGNVTHWQPLPNAPINK